jgi:hypothetical protein
MGYQHGCIRLVSRQPWLRLRTLHLPPLPLLQTRAGGTGHPLERLHAQQVSLLLHLLRHQFTRPNHYGGPADQTLHPTSTRSVTLLVYLVTNAHATLFSVPRALLRPRNHSYYGPRQDRCAFRHGHRRLLAMLLGAHQRRAPPRQRTQ